MDQNLSTSRLWVFQMLLIGGFVLALLAPLADMTFHLDSTEVRSENRVRASFPTPPGSLHDIPKTVKAFDAFFSDHFGFRNYLIRLYGCIKYFGLKTSASELVVLGKSGWLFFARQDNVNLHRNVHPFTQEEVDKYVLWIRERQAWAEQNGAQYIFMVGPDNHTLNPEFLPDWAQQKVSPESRMDQLIAGAKKYGIDILDFRPALAEAKKIAMISHQTDSHWNSYGGYIAYREVIERIRARYPEVAPPLPMSDYEMQKTKTAGMDLALIMGIRDLVSDTGNALIYKGKRKFKSVDPQGLHFTTINEGVPEFPIVLVSDSMAGELFPNLALHFSKLRVLWGYLFETAEISSYHPKVILHMVIERSLGGWGLIENTPEVKEALLRQTAKSGR